MRARGDYFVANKVPLGADGDLEIKTRLKTRDEVVEHLALLERPVPK